MPAVQAPAIKVDSSPLAANWLQQLSSARIDRALGVVGRAVLRFVDSGYALSTSSVLGLGSIVEISQPGTSSTVLFSGEVTGVALDQSTGQAPELVVTVDDLAYKLTRSTSSRTLMNMPPDSIVRKLAEGTGLSVSSEAGNVDVDYLLQAGSDLAFLDQLAARTNCVWWVGPPKTLWVKKVGTTQATVPLVLGDQLVRFAVRATGLAADQVVVTGWDVKAQKKLVQAVKASGPAESTFVESFRTGAARGANRQVVAGLSPLTAAEATTLATSLVAESRAGAVVARGTCLVDGRIAPSTTVDVTNAGPSSGKYLVTGVEHVYDRRGFHTMFTAGPHRPAGLVDVLGAPTLSPGLSMDGVVAATVTNVTDDAKLGRAKVRYSTPEGDIESPWARIVTLGAGAKRGLVFQPEVGDEVLVAFERGDTRRPVILGGLFSDVNGLPTTDNVDGNKVAYRRITSRLGHVVELSDGTAAASQHIMLQVGGTEHRIRLGADSVDITVTDKPVTITNGKASISFSEQGDITIEGQSLTINTKMDVKVEAKAKVALTGKAGVDVKGGMVTVKADMVGSVEAGGPLTIKGATVAIN